MCINADFHDIKVATSDMIVYKVCRINSKGMPISEYKGPQRSMQNGYNTKGRTIVYRKGDTVKSLFPNTPGIFCYLMRPLGYYIPHKENVIEIKIKKGTRYVEGRTPCLRERKTINAESVYVIGPVP